MEFDDRIIIASRQPDGSYKTIDVDDYNARADAPIDEEDAAALAAFARAQADLFLQKRDAEVAAASDKGRTAKC